MSPRIHIPIALLLLAGTVFAQSPFEQEPGSVKGFAADTIDIVQNQPLSFGAMTAGSGGSVTITWDGLRTAAGVIPFGAAGFGPSSFVVTITGKGSPQFTVTLPAATTLTGPGAPMQVDTFQLDPAAGKVDPRTGRQIFNVGATLRVAANQLPGPYSGTYPVTVHLGN